MTVIQGKLSRSFLKSSRFDVSAGDGSPVSIGCDPAKPGQACCRLQSEFVQELIGRCVVEVRLPIDLEVQLNSRFSNLLIFLRSATRVPLVHFAQLGNVLVACFDRCRVRNMAALLTIVVHGIILSPLVITDHDRDTRGPLTRNSVSNVMNAGSGEFVSTVIFLADQSANANRQPDAIHSPSITVAQNQNAAVVLQKMIEDLHLEISGDEDMRQSLSSPIDPAERAISFARYMGEVTSRIERSWTLPSTPLETGFHCRVQIRRDEVGMVKEVTLQHCDAEPEIRMSVVQAIQKASPLPLLPGVSAFSEALTLDFQAAPGPIRERRTSVQPASDDS